MTPTADLTADLTATEQHPARRALPPRQRGDRWYCPRGCKLELTREATPEGVEHACWRCGYRWYEPGRGPAHRRADGPEEPDQDQDTAPDQDAASPPLPQEPQPQPYEARAMVELARVTMGTQASEVPAWGELARARLDAVLAQVAALEALRFEAERLHQALMAYGLPDLPALPWVRPKPAAGVVLACAMCGVPFRRLDAQSRYCSRSCSARGSAARRLAGRQAQAEAEAAG